MFVSAIRFALLTMLLVGLLYPGLMVLVGKAVFPFQANGSLITNARGQVIGSALIGQSFTQAHYFHPRPSANGYDASNSGGANLGVTQKKLLDRIQKDAESYQVSNHPTSAIPIDAITQSGSGLDPDISLANALLQVNRVAKARGLSPQIVKQLVKQHTRRHALLNTSPVVRVFQLNLALDKLSPKSRFKS